MANTEILNPNLDRSSVNAYINGLSAQIDKLYLSLYRDSSLEGQAQADVVKQLYNYVKVTQYYPEKEEIPPRDEK